MTEITAKSKKVTKKKVTKKTTTSGPSLAKQLSMKKTQEVRHIQHLKVANMKVQYLERKLDTTRIWAISIALLLSASILYTMSILWS
jgi:biotin operon repressor|tara:strand:+ start:275 stop:535 length:261 start_codon:yes stop_codon:yes gene_type:complete